MPTGRARAPVRLRRSIEWCTEAGSAEGTRTQHRCMVPPEPLQRAARLTEELERLHCFPTGMKNSEIQRPRNPLSPIVDQYQRTGHLLHAPPSHVLQLDAPHTLLPDVVRSCTKQCSRVAFLAEPGSWSPGY